jgi:hypothetical protein
MYIIRVGERNSVRHLRRLVNTLKIKGHTLDIDSRRLDRRSVDKYNAEIIRLAKVFKLGKG